MNSTIEALKETLSPISEIVTGLKQKTRNELAGPCPWCGGNDRFVVFKDSGRFLCRGCRPDGGDVVDFHCINECLDISELSKKHIDNAKHPERSGNSQRKTTGRYNYYDEAGELLYWKERVEPGKDGRDKDFYFHHGTGQNGRGCKPVLYHLPDIIHAKTVIITEGEKHADLLKSWGLSATSLDSGAQSKPTPQMIEQLSGKRIAILRDNDQPGLTYGLTLAEALRQKSESLKVVLLPGLSEKGDIVDWAHNPANDKARLLDIIKNTPEWEPVGGKDEGMSLVNEWPEPLLFGEIETPEIPCNLLPGFLGDYCQAVKETTQTPSGLAVMFGLSTVAACLQRRFEVCPFGDDYTEPLSIWTITALDPGNRKTAVKAALTYPLTFWENEQAEILKPEIKRVKNLRDVNLKRIDQLKARAAKPETEDADRDTFLREIIKTENETPDEITSPRLWTDDVTPERLQALLSNHGERMALLSDEGGIFEIMAGLYSGGRGNMNVFLQGHAGAPVRVDRQGRAVVLNKPALTFGLAVQTDIISDLSNGNKTRFRGNGTLARFLYCIPKSTIGHRDVTRRVSIPDSVKTAYEHGIMSLLNIEPVYDETGKERAGILTLKQDALSIWQQFNQYIESKQGTSGEYYSIQDWTSKLPGAALRIAGLFHVIEYGPGIPKINQQTMERSLDLCDLLICHAQAAFDLMGDDSASADAKAILTWIVAGGYESFSLSECYQGVRRFRNAERMDKALAALSSRYILKGPIKKSTGGRPTIHYQVNPEILQTQTRVIKALKA